MPFESLPRQSSALALLSSSAACLCKHPHRTNPRAHNTLRASSFSALATRVACSSLLQMVCEA